MAVTAFSYIDSDQNGVIRLFSDTPWTTNEWSGRAHYDGVHTRYNLYPVVGTGVGSFSDNQHTLTVTLEQPPPSFELSVGDFRKIFYFEDGKYEDTGVLVHAPSLLVGSEAVGVGGRAAEALVYFNTVPDVHLEQESYRANLVLGDEVVGYALGQRFIAARTNDNVQHGFGGVVFPRIVWEDRPTAPVDLLFMLRIEGKTFVRTVPYNGTTFTGPYSGRFVVQPTHEFRLERERDYFFL